MEDEIHSANNLLDAALVAHVADVELELAAVVALAHIVLLLLVAREDTDLGDFGIEESFEDGVAKGSCATGDQ